MYYNSFLNLLSQLVFQEKGKILLCDCQITVKNFPKFSIWELSSEILLSDFPSHIKECLRFGRKFLLDSSNSYLQQNHQESITFVQTVSSPKKYLQYKRCIENFLKEISLWK